MAANRSVDALHRQIPDSLLELGVPCERPTEIQPLGQYTHEATVLGSRKLPRLQVTLLRDVQLVVGEPLVEDPLDFLTECGLDLLRVFRRLDGGRRRKSRFRR